MVMYSGQPIIPGQGYSELPFDGSQLTPQGWFGNFLGGVGAPLGGAIGGIFGNQQLGGQVGGVAGGLVRRYLPFEVDPTAALYGQIAPQGWFGDLLGSVGAPVGGAIGGIFGNPQLGNQIGGVAGGLARRYLPFEVDPLAAYGGAGQIVPQGIFGSMLGGFGGRLLGGALGGLLGNRGLGQQIGSGIGGIGGGLLPFGVDPVAAAYGQLTPLGWLGNLLGSVGAPVGGTIGGMFGNAQLGNQLGGVAGGLARRYLPFEVDPMAALYGQLAPQSLFGEFPSWLRPRFPPISPTIPYPIFNSMLGRPIGAPQNGMSTPIAA